MGRKRHHEEEEGATGVGDPGAAAAGLPPGHAAPASFFAQPGAPGQPGQLQGMPGMQFVQAAPGQQVRIQQAGTQPGMQLLMQPGMQPGMVVMQPGMQAVVNGVNGSAASPGGLSVGFDINSLPKAFRKRAAAALGSSAGAPPSTPQMVGTMGNPLLAMSPNSNPMLAMAMLGGVANSGGIAGNIAMPMPVKPAQEVVKREPVSNSPDPDIVELFDHFHIDPRHLSRFQTLMDKREGTFAGDMLKIWELMEQARSPEGMLVSKMREMECGTFIGKTVPDESLLELSRKFKLDSQAESKLSDVLAKYDPERRQEYMKDIDRHLETSSRPSAMVMMFLKKMGEGIPLGKPGPPAPGCYLDRQRRQQEDSRRPKDKEYRPRSPGGGRDRDRDRDRRDRSRDRDRERSRSRDRSRRDRE